jgi:polar amino acid transport system substrate-binding protein
LIALGMKATGRAGWGPLSPHRAIGLALAAWLQGACCGTAAAAIDVSPLRVCADPDNLPFTSRTSATPGLYLELAQHLADQLGRRLEPVWAATYAPQRMLRTTLLAHRCDMFPGVPFEAEGANGRVLLSAPLIDVGYALVTPAGSTIDGLAALSGKRVAVQFGTPVQAMMVARRDVDAVTVVSLEEGMRALQAGRVDAALLWGPSAGYVNTADLASSYRVVPLVEDGMQWKASIGFAPGSEALRDRVNDLLAHDIGEIRALAARYGFPVEADPAPVRPAATSDSVSPGFGEDLQIPSISKGAPLPPGAHAQPQTPAGEGAGSSAESGSAAPASADAARIREGTDLFNSTCAHCHGPDAVQAERRINLRLLHHRYGDGMDDMFFTTVTHGRPDKGMPNWSGVFTDDQFKAILAFLRSVQDER